MDKCKKCDGTGIIGGRMGNILIDYDCPECDGLGHKEEVISVMENISKTLTWMEKVSDEDDK